MSYINFNMHIIIVMANHSVSVNFIYAIQCLIWLSPIKMLILSSFVKVDP